MSAPNEEEVMDVEEEVIDELCTTFEDLEESLSEMTPATAPALCAKYQAIMSNERSDEVATKLKEKSIYRLVSHILYLYYQLLNDGRGGKTRLHKSLFMVILLYLFSDWPAYTQSKETSIMS